VIDNMHPDIEITPHGRLLQRRQVDTPNGLREKVQDISDEAQHWLDQSVTLQPGTRLSAIFELLKANAALRDLYKRNWADDYVARYEAIRDGQVVPDASEDADTNEPTLEALVLTRHQEIRLPASLLAMMADATALKAPAPHRNLNLLTGSQAKPSDGPAPVIKDAYSRWHISARSVPFAQDTELWGTPYKAGSHISYSVSFSFDRCIDLPLCIGVGSVTFTITGQRRKDRLTVDVPLGTEQDPPSITLHELIGAITCEFSFHGGPSQTQAESEKLKQVLDELDDERHAEDLRFGMAHVFCPDGKLKDIAARKHDLEDATRFWARALVMEHTGWTEAQLKAKRRQGRLLELRSFATHVHPDRTTYPAEQFAPGFDAELLRFVSWVASMSCSEWATHTFLTEWHASGPRDTLINGWAVMALPDAPLTHEPLTDDIFKAHGKQIAPMRPVFAPTSPKRALVEAFEAFAARRRLDHEQRDELEDED
jgi:hypothetical protein